MPMQVTLDDILARRGVTARSVARKVGLSETQLSNFRSGKVRGIRFSTLSRLCWVLDCQPGELLAYFPDPQDLLDT